MKHLVAAAVGALALASPSIGQEEIDLANFKPEVIAPYSWQSSPIDTITVADVQAAIDNGDPLQVFFRSFILLRLAAQSDDAALLSEVRAKLDYMLEDSDITDLVGEARQWRYGYAFESFGPGWRSGMDTFLGPLTYWTLSQMTGEQRYADIALATAKLGITSPPDGGVLWREDYGCWVSEFAGDGMTKEQETYVMNGHLYGLEALYLLSEVSGDAELQEAYACARKGTEARFSEYYMPEKEWLYYQTSPKVVEPGHYFLFEVGQLWSLYQVTGDEFYRDAMETRAGIFADRFPLVLKPSESGFDVLVASIGVPNTYWPDNYGIDLSCQVEGKEVRQIFVDTYDATRPFAERLVPAMSVTSEPTECTYSVKRGDFSMPVYTQAEFDVVDGEREVFDAAPEVSYDGKPQPDGTFLLTRSEELQEARVTYPITTPFGFNDIVAVPITPSEVMKMSILLYGEGGSYIHREYRNLQADCENLILFTKIGFDHHEALIGGLTSVVIRIATTDLTEPATVEAGQIEVLRDPGQLKSFLHEKASACISMQ